jgi:hypothetical protein
MFVLMSLIFACLQRLFALCPGINRPIAPVPRASFATYSVAQSQRHPLAPIHEPPPRLII